MKYKTDNEVYNSGSSLLTFIASMNKLIIFSLINFISSGPNYSYYSGTIYG